MHRGIGHAGGRACPSPASERKCPPKVHTLDHSSTDQVHSIPTALHRPCDPGYTPAIDLNRIPLFFYLYTPPPCGPRQFRGDRSGVPMIRRQHGEGLSCSDGGRKVKEKKPEFPATPVPSHRQHPLMPPVDSPVLPSCPGSSPCPPPLRHPYS